LLESSKKALRLERVVKQAGTELTEQPQKVDDKVRISELLRIYGGLLSGKQCEMLKLHIDEDFGFSEIAEEFGITRQAVYDSTKQGRLLLEKYELELELYTKGENENQGSGAFELEEVRKIIHSLEKLLNDDILFDTLKLKKKIKQLKQTLFSKG